MASYETFAQSQIDDEAGTGTANNIVGHLLDSSNTLNGKYITEVTFRLKADPTTTSGSYYCRVYSSSGTLKHTFGSASMSGLGDSFANYTFTTDYDTAIAENDCICIEANNDNLKIAQRDGDVSPNGHRVRGNSGSSFILDTTKDIFFACEYSDSGGSGGGGSGGGGGSSGGSSSDGSISGTGGSSYNPEYAMRLNIGYIR